MIIFQKGPNVENNPGT